MSADPSITVIATGMLMTNCCIVADRSGTECAIIDPGAEPGRIIEAVRKCGAAPRAVFLTHGHYDHVGAVPEIAMNYSCPVFLHAADRELYRAQADMIAASGGTGLWQNMEDYSEDREYRFGPDNELVFKVLFTPGHTPGGVCLYIRNKKTAFTGDTLFREACGRTDMPGGSRRDLDRSLRKLGENLRGYTLYPGHEDMTTMEHELSANIFLTAVMGGGA